MQRTISRRIFIERALVTGTGAYGAFVLGGCSQGGETSQAQTVPIENGPAPAPAPTPADTGWKRLRLGAGGYVTGINITQDGTKVVRTDTHNAYIWNEQTKIWDELLTRKTLPQGDVPFPVYSGDQSGGGRSDGPGCWEAAAANSNSSVIYAVWNAWCYRSTDRGKSFQKTALPRIYARANDQNFGGGRAHHGPEDGNRSGQRERGLAVGRHGRRAVGDRGRRRQLDATCAATQTAPTAPIRRPTSGHTSSFSTRVRRSSAARRKGSTWPFTATGCSARKTPVSTFMQIPGAPTAFRRLTCDQLGRVWICDTSTISPADQEIRERHLVRLWIEQCPPC